MNFLSILATVLLLAPPLVIAGFWRASVRHRLPLRPGHLPDSEAIVMARVGGILCALLPIVQMVASLIRHRTGEPGMYLWFLVPFLGVVLALFALSLLLAHARGYERTVSSSMVLVSVCTLLLLTLLGAPGTS